MAVCHFLLNRLGSIDKDMNAKTADVVGYMLSSWLLMCCALPVLCGWSDYTVIFGSVAAGLILGLGKMLGQRLGVRSTFWSTPLTVGEWSIVLLVMLGIVVLVCEPVAHNQAARIVDPARPVVNSTHK